MSSNSTSPPSSDGAGDSTFSSPPPPSNSSPDSSSPPPSSPSPPPPPPPHPSSSPPPGPGSSSPPPSSQSPPPHSPPAPTSSPPPQTPPHGSSPRPLTPSNVPSPLPRSKSPPPAPESPRSNDPSLQPLPSYSSIPPPSSDSFALPPPPPPPHRSRTSSTLSPPASTSKSGGGDNGAGDIGSNSNGGGSNDAAVIGATIAVIALVSLFALCCCCWICAKRRKRRTYDIGGMYRAHGGDYPGNANPYYYSQPGVGNSAGSNFSYSKPSGASPYSSTGYGGYGSQTSPSPEGLVTSKSCFNYEELMEITNGFSRANLLGEGGFGCVYKGCLPDGREVAVKQLKAGAGQGEREFRAEVEIISRVHHRHLVSLVGYSIAENQRLLVYEFVPNQTVEHHLHGKGQPPMDWSRRLKIAIGAARGLAYLHEDCHPRIIHRDIKSANILLDNAFEAQVADFGLAKLTNDTHTHVSTRVVGTFGYLAPEYASSGKLTDRSDVFSFGVVLLELVTGQKPIDPRRPLGDESLVEWARPLLSKALETGNLEEIVDPRLGNRYVESEMLRMVEAGAACVRHSAQKRPKMVQVVRALDCETDMSDLTNGVKLGQSTIYEADQHAVDLQRFRKMAFGDGTSSDFSMSEYIDGNSSTFSREYQSREMPSKPPRSRFVDEYENHECESDTVAMNPRSYK